MELLGRWRDTLADDRTPPTNKGNNVHHPTIEKEATALKEAVRKWSDFLLRREFYMITDQCSVSLILGKRKRIKINNYEIQGWRLALASYSNTIHYRPGRQNVGPDTLTRATCASMTNSSSRLSDIHDQLCHPRVTRLLHLVRIKNLPYSTDDIKKWHSYKFCAELKPQFSRHQGNSSHGTMEHRFQMTSQIIISEYIHAYYR